MYVNAVASNHDWAQLLADATALEDLTGVINSSGTTSSSRVTRARSPSVWSGRFWARGNGSGRSASDLLATLDPEQAPVVLRQLDEVERRIGLMTDQAREVLALYGLGRRDEAARRMASMDREYGRLLGAMRELRVPLRRGARAAAGRRARPRGDAARTPAITRWERFEQQTQTAAALQRWEFLLGVLIVLMVAAAVVYGRKTAAFMKQGRRRQGALHRGAARGARRPGEAGLRAHPGAAHLGGAAAPRGRGLAADLRGHRVAGAAHGPGWARAARQPGRGGRGGRGPAGPGRPAGGRERRRALDHRGAADAEPGGRRQRAGARSAQRARVGGLRQPHRRGGRGRRPRRGRGARRHAHGRAAGGRTPRGEAGRHGLAGRRAWRTRCATRCSALAGTMDVLEARFADNEAFQKYIVRACAATSAGCRR